MSPIMLRQLWSLVEASQSNILLSLDDTSLVHWLLKQLRTQDSLNPEEMNLYSTYIRSRLPLIRDMARHRTAA
jgi:hypothetical protein